MAQRRCSTIGISYLGEENSKVTWRDLASNLVAGALLICLGVAMANYAVGVFGASAIS